MLGRSDKQIADTIIEQLGGQQMKAMTGARDFVICKNGVQFKLPRHFAKSGINRVQIVLDPGDAYTVTFNKWSRAGLKKIAEFDNTYCDQLQGLFEEVTGLKVRMGGKDENEHGVQ